MPSSILLSPFPCVTLSMFSAGTTTTASGRRRCEPHAAAEHRHWHRQLGGDLGSGGARAAAIRKRCRRRRSTSIGDLAAAAYGCFVNGGHCGNRHPAYQHHGFSMIPIRGSGGGLCTLDASTMSAS
uniref:Uncharacterized protein n=1 Tax=Arundo donax TaxID=35708 RepID=A0A0A9GIF2_ARUDO